MSASDATVIDGPRYVVVVDRRLGLIYRVRRYQRAGQ